MKTIINFLLIEQSGDRHKSIHYIILSYLLYLWAVSHFYMNISLIYLCLLVIKWKKLINEFA